MITRLQISALVAFIVAVWGISLVFYGFEICLEMLKPFSVVVGAVVTVLIVADKWLWRIPFLNPLLFNMPDLNGTWRTTIRPTAPTSSLSEVEGYMVVRQTYSSISVRLFTAESHSETLSARVYCCDDGTFTVAVVYRNVPRLTVREESPLHNGAFTLSVQGAPPQSLFGEYWTSRLSQGELELTGRRTISAHSFDQAKQVMESAT